MLSITRRKLSSLICGGAFAVASFTAIAGTASAADKITVGALRFTSHSASFVAFERGYFTENELTLVEQSDNRHGVLTAIWAVKEAMLKFEKGKYDWDTKSNTVTLNGRKGSKTRILRILNKGDELVVLDPKGKPMTGNQDQYTLVRSDKNKAREVHIH